MKLISEGELSNSWAAYRIAECKLKNDYYNNIIQYIINMNNIKDDIKFVKDYKIPYSPYKYIQLECNIDLNRIVSDEHEDFGPSIGTYKTKRNVIIDNIIIPLQYKTVDGIICDIREKDYNLTVDYYRYGMTSKREPIGKSCSVYDLDIILSYVKEEYERRITNKLNSRKKQ